MINTNTIAYTMALTALVGALLMRWQQLRPAVAVMNVLALLTSLATVSWGWFIYEMAHLWGQKDSFGAAVGLANVVPYVIVTPICMVASMKLARQDRRSAIYVAFIPVALAAVAAVAFKLALLTGGLVRSHCEFTGRHAQNNSAADIRAGR